MRKIISLFIFALLINCSTKSEQGETIYTKMEIKYVDLNILTPIEIDCTSFESFFNEDVKNKVITDKSVIKKFVSVLNQLPIDSICPDTRIMVVLYDNKHNKQKICIDKFSVFDGSNRYSNTESLLKIINEVLIK